MASQSSVHVMSKRPTAILIDLDGVIYEGEASVAGARECIAWLVAERIPHLFVTNTTSRPRSALVQKLGRLGIDIGADRILTPPVAAVDWLEKHAAGSVALFVPEATRAEFEVLSVAETGESVAAVVIGDYGEQWSFAELNRAFRLLMSEPQPELVALGMTRYWRAHDGLRLDTGAFVAALASASGAEPIVLGKPAEPFFMTALSRLGVDAADTIMIGDDIQGDVGGAQRCGLGGVLVRTGKFRPADLESDIEPTQVLDSIADLRGWWRSMR
jgi:phospholysine phosphohistidine inorganic pyrophosphate phosphatase